MQRVWLHQYSLIGLVPEVPVVEIWFSLLTNEFLDWTITFSCDPHNIHRIISVAFHIFTVRWIRMNSLTGCMKYERLVGLGSVRLAGSHSTGNHLGHAFQSAAIDHLSSLGGHFLPGGCV